MESVDPNLFLSEQEIIEYTHVMLEEVAKTYAKIWWKKYGGTVEFDDLFSDASIAMLKALRTYRKDMGASVKTWVTGSVWRSVSNTGKARFTRRYNGPMQWPVYRDGSDVRFEDKNVEPVDKVHDIRLARKICDMAMSELNHHERRFFKMKFIESKNDSEIARECGISRQAVNVRSRRVMKRVRRMAMKIQSR